jgi:predicted transcriptional regulator
MSQHAQEKHDPARVPLGAFIDRDQRQELTEIAQRDDRSVSSIVRLALSDYLGREHEGDS